MKRILTHIAVAIAIVMASFQHALACPSCADNFTKGSANAGIGEAYSWSVLFLLAVPITIVTAFVVAMWRRQRLHSRA